VDDVLSKVPELANNSDEARHSHARQQSLGVVFACRPVQLWIGKSQLIPKFISNQRHFSNTLDSSSSSSFLNFSSHPPKPSLNAFRLVHSSALLLHLHISTSPPPSAQNTLIYSSKLLTLHTHTSTKGKQAAHILTVLNPYAPPKKLYKSLEKEKQLPSNNLRHATNKNPNTHNLTNNSNSNFYSKEKQTPSQKKKKQTNKQGR
jgi:hypothetical protein